MKVLGLDPGSRILGFGVLEPSGPQWRRVDSGIFRLDVKRPLPQRLAQAFHEVRGLLQRHRPSRVAIEECFVARSPKAALVLGEVRGVLLLAAALEEAELVEYAPRAVKLAAVGNGGAAKEQIQFMIPRLIPGCAAELLPDEADALAVAWCGAIHWKQDQVVASAAAPRR
jgi:crossover junction endodeoxyribonuclease RuvC